MTESPWKHQDPKSKKIVESLRSLPLIYVESEDQFRHIHEFMDPLDKTVQGCRGDEIEGGMPLPPDPYMQTLILKTMRKSGMLTLSEPRIFKQLARQAVEDGDLDASIRLLRFLVSASQGGKLSFTSQDYSYLRELDWIPYYDFRGF